VVGDVQDYDTDANTGFADVAFAFAAPFEGCAVPLVVWYFLLFCALLDAAAVPHGDCDESCEPEYCVNDIDGEEGESICEALGAGPRWHHDEVNYSWYRQEALKTKVSLELVSSHSLLPWVVLAYQSKVVPSRAASFPLLCEDGNGDA
jgi:hypothetical protein